MGRFIFNHISAYFEEKNRYRFDRSWTFRASQGQVWRELVDIEAWPGWWAGLEDIRRLDAGGPLGSGSRILSVWKGLFFYHLAFEAEIISFKPGSQIAFWATGDLEGLGICRLREDRGQTRVRFYWQVSPTKLWLKFSAPFARSLYLEHHDLIMAAAEFAMVRKLSRAVDGDGHG